MLDMMLANNKDRFSTGEVNALFMPYRPHHYNPLCGCGFADCTLWQQVKKRGTKKLYHSIFSLFPEVNSIIDSSKTLQWVAKQTSNLSKTDIKTKHVLIWKSPQEFAYSKHKRNEGDWEKEWLSYHRLLMTLLPNFYNVPYRSLAQEPEKVLQKLCSYLDIKYHNKQKEFWNSHHHTLFGNSSAKTHLKNTPDPLDKAHRKIYYNGDCIKKLPQNIIQEIESNKMVYNITSLLNEFSHTDMGSIETIKERKILMNSLELLNIKHRSLVRQILGRSIGRFVKIF